MKILVRFFAISIIFTSAWANAGIDSPVTTVEKVSPIEENNDREKLSDAWMIGSMVAANAIAIPAGHWLFQPYFSGAMINNQFDDNSNLHGLSPSGYTSLKATALIQYGVTDNFTLGLIPQGFYGFGNNEDSSSGPQLGDTTFQLSYMLTSFHADEWCPAIALQVNQSFPTGDYTNLSTPFNGVGSGAYATNIALNTQSYFWINDRVLCLHTNMSYTVATDVDIENISSYNTGTGFIGKANPGDTMQAIVSLEYSLTKNWVPAIDLIYTHQNNTHVYGNSCFDSGSSENFTIVPALEYNVNSTLGFIAGVQFTAWGRNTPMAITPKISVCMFF